MQYYIQNIDAEISGWGKTEIKDGNIYVKDIVIFKQIVTGSTTELDQDARALFGMELKRAGEKQEDWNLWWHSHNTMDTFWSSTDEKAIANEIGCIPFLLSIVSNKAKKILSRIDVTMTHNTPFEIECGQKTMDKLETIVEPVEVSDEEYLKYEKLNLEVDNFKEKIKALKTGLEEKEKELSEFISSKEEDPAMEAECIKEIEEKVTEKKNIQSKLPKYKKFDWIGKKNGTKIRDVEDRYYNAYDYNIDDDWNDHQIHRDVPVNTTMTLDEYIDKQFLTKDEKDINEFYINEDFKLKMELIKDVK